LASIGYHYRSTEALLQAAMISAIEEWGEKLERALAVDIDPKATSMERFEMIWTRITESLAGYRPLWIATIEATAQIDRAPQVREFLANALQQAREGLAAMFQNIDEVDDEKQRWQLGSFYYAMMSGVMVQWLIDPERAPSGHDLAEALQIILGSIQPDTHERD
jgi:AcrR family transcriptional regulator